MWSYRVNSHLDKTEQEDDVKGEQKRKGRGKKDLDDLDSDDDDDVEDLSDAEDEEFESGSRQKNGASSCTTLPDVSRVNIK